VRVINFIAEGGIEHGMLGLLKFKRSMFSGVLDKGDNDIFMGESRFNRFMKTIEEATDTLKTGEDSESVARETAGDRETARQQVEEGTDDTPGPERPSLKAEAFTSPLIPREAITNVLQMGSAFFKQLSESLNEQDQEKKTPKPGSSLGIRLNKDEHTGRKILQISIPEDETRKQLITVVEGFLNLLKQ